MSSAAVQQNILDGRPDKKISSRFYHQETFAELEDVNLDVKFDPEIHLAFSQDVFASTKRLTMKELQINEPNAISEIGGTNPFPLFTEEAVQIMRAQFLRQSVFEKYGRISNYSMGDETSVQVRGYARACPFIYQAWTHPKTLAIISKMAGVDLEIIFDYEIAHANVTLQSKQKAAEERKKFDQTPQYDPASDAIVSWHNDSYPFVCVLMLSDAQGMVNGETVIRKGNGEVAKIPDPKLGWACVLQGRYIRHFASRAIGGTERITHVTSFKARDVWQRDDSFFGHIIPEVHYVTQYNQFYPDYASYRATYIAKQCEALSKEVLRKRENGEDFDKEATMNAFLKMAEYLRDTVKETEYTDRVMF